MHSRFECPDCGQEFDQALPDVTPEEARQLRKDVDDRRVVFECPSCHKKMSVLRWDIPSLPPSP
jgi:predicted RNA-binding Zn-ribbon protein involved in translation (DUF1610 family)